MREIISEQLGTDLDKVAPDAKFVDLGADSLDTVCAPLSLLCARICTDMLCTRVSQCSNQACGHFGGRCGTSKRAVC